MFLKIVLPDKSLLTKSTLVGWWPVCQIMLSQAALFSEPLLTEGAGKRSLFGVASVVGYQLALGGKSLLTLAALQAVVLFLLVD